MGLRKGAGVQGWAGAAVLLGVAGGSWEKTGVVDADLIVVGAGLAGLAATHELTRAGKRVALVDQECPANLGGQAFWSFGRCAGPAPMSSSPPGRSGPG